MTSDDPKMPEGMVWGYRFCRKSYPFPGGKAPPVVRIELHEVYFVDGKPVSWTKEPVRLIAILDEEDGRGPEAEKKALEWLQDKINKAFGMEILDLDVMEREAEERREDEQDA